MTDDKAQATMPDAPEKPFHERRPELFLQGFLHDRFAAGYRPKYGYPASPLPDTGGRTMEVVTSFIGGRPKKD